MVIANRKVTFKPREKVKLIITGVSLILVTIIFVGLINRDTRQTAVTLCSQYPSSPASAACPDGPDSTFKEQFGVRFSVKHFFLSDVAFREIFVPLGYSRGTNYLLSDIPNCELVNGPGELTINSAKCIIDSPRQIGEYHRRLLFYFGLWVATFTLMALYVVKRLFPGFLFWLEDEVTHKD